MSNPVEIGILLAALIAAAYLVADVAWHGMRQRREGEMLERLPGDTAGAPPPVESGRMDRRLRAAGLPGPAEAYLFVGSLVAAAVSLVLLGLLPEIGRAHV